MTDHAKISVTIKAGSQTSDPWIVFHGDSVDEVGYMIQEVMSKGVTDAVKRASAMFANGAVSTEQAVATVQRSMPGAQVVDDPWAGTNATPQQPTPPPGWQPQPPAQQLPAGQGTPPCATCGGPTTFRQGVAKGSGKPYKGYFCAQNRDHKPNFI